MVDLISRRALLVYGAGAGLLASSPLLAQALAAVDPATKGDAVDAAANTALEPPPDPTMMVEDQISEFIDKSGFGARERRGELFILKGTAPVIVPSTNPDWVKARSLAYAAALLNAQASHVGGYMAQIISDTKLELAKARDDEVPAYVDSKAPGVVAEMSRKAVGVVTSAFDGKLRENGIDPAAYERAPEAQRKTLLKNGITKHAFEKAYGDVTGLLPVQTFEGQGAAHDFVVGVVAVVSTSMKDFATQVLTARGEFQPNLDKAQDLTKLYASKEQLLSDFGVRRLYDEQGLPVIVSFAQSGSSYRGTNAAVAASYREVARGQATVLADTQIAEFLKANVEIDQTPDTAAELERVAVSLPDSATVEETTKVADEFMKVVIRKSKVTLTGLQTLHEWTGKHPASETPVIGVIRMWSASGERRMHELNAPRPKVVAGHAQGVPDAGSTPGITHGRVLMDANDF
jgi:hypothetical protein